MSCMTSIIDMTLLNKQEDVDSEAAIVTFVAAQQNGTWQYVYKRDFSGGIKTKVEIKMDSTGPDLAELCIERLAAFIHELPRLGECVNSVKIDCDVT